MIISKIEESNNILKEFILMDSMPNQISYKFWDEKKKEMHIVYSISYSSIGFPISITNADGHILACNDGILIHSTGYYDKELNEIYGGDILTCGFIDTAYKDRVVFWDNGWRVMGMTTSEFKDNCEDLSSIIGNIYEDDDLYKIYKEKYKCILNT